MRRYTHNYGMQYEQVNLLHFQILRNMKKIYDLQLRPLRCNPWQQLCEFSQKRDIEIGTLLQDPKFFNKITVSLQRNSLKPFHRIWDCLDSTNISWQLNTFFICHQRDDNIEQIVQIIRFDKIQTCEVCKQVGHGIRRCSQTKLAFQKRRVSQAYNPRNENQLGACANSVPFDKLADITIPQKFFEKVCAFRPYIYF